MKPFQRSHSNQSGLSLVELMVSIAIGLLIVAAATTVLVNQLTDHRQLLLETQVQQDLRSAVDVIVRDLRRSGYWERAERGVSQGNAAPIKNDYVALKNAAGNAVATKGPPTIDAITYTYARHDDRATSTPSSPEDNAVTDNERFGARLRAGVLELQLGAGNWQALTDLNVARITKFEISPRTQCVSLDEFYDMELLPGATPPKQQIRHLSVLVEAIAAHDSKVVRTIQANIRLRNDNAAGNCDT